MPGQGRLQYGTPRILPTARGHSYTDPLGKITQVMIRVFSNATVLQSITSYRGYQAFFRGYTEGLIFIPHSLR
jgi:hypothetical protein